MALTIVVTTWSRHPQLEACAVRFVASAKRHGYDVWQYSDGISPRIDGVDRFEIVPREARLTCVYCADVWAQIPLERYVVMDVDQLILLPIDEGMEGDAAVTLFDRPHRNPDQRYSGGLIFVRDPAFMRDVAKYVRECNEHEQAWTAGQSAIARVVTERKHRVRTITDARWNWTPNYKGQAIPADVRVLHFKGHARKDWMEAYGTA